MWDILQTRAFSEAISEAFPKAFRKELPVHRFPFLHSFSFTVI